MAEHPILFTPDMVRSLLEGKKTEARLLATSPLRTCQPGDRLWVKEPCFGGVLAADGSHELSALIRTAEFVVLKDGWRQYRNGSGRQGAVPTNPNLRWMPAIHMPRWGSRIALIVESVRIDRLQNIDRDGVCAEGQLACFGGLYWRWRQPVRGMWRDFRPAYAALWNGAHGTSGERWEDDPEIVVLGVRRETP